MVLIWRNKVRNRNRSSGGKEKEERMCKKKVPHTKLLIFYKAIKAIYDLILDFYQNVMSFLLMTQKYISTSFMFKRNHENNLDLKPS